MDIDESSILLNQYQEVKFLDHVAVPLTIYQGYFMHIKSTVIVFRLFGDF